MRITNTIAMQRNATLDLDLMRAIAMLSETLVLLDNLGETIAAANVCGVIDQLDRHMVQDGFRPH